MFSGGGGNFDQNERAFNARSRRARDWVNTNRAQVVCDWDEHGSGANNGQTKDITVIVTELIRIDLEGGRRLRYLRNLELFLIYISDLPQLYLDT